MLLKSGVSPLRWRASFSAVRGSSSEEYSRTSRPLRARPFRVALSIAICVTEAKTVALSLTECPGISTQPFSSFSAVNGESATGRVAGSARPGTTTVIASSLTDATCRRSPPETRSPGIFLSPSVARRLPPAFFPAGTATSCCPGRKYAPPAFRPAHPAGSGCDSALSPGLSHSGHDCVSPGSTAAITIPRSVHISRR